MPTSTPMIPGGAIPPDLVSRFASLFTGYSRAYGIFTPGRSTNGKVGGKALTERGEASPEHYAAHLLGSLGLGIVLLRDDDTSTFGAIDYDVRTMDHALYAKRVAELGLPLVLCRSKSGGGHFYCFTAEPVDARIMRARLAEFAAVLGIATIDDRPVEIFPKQTTRVAEADIGSWINLPYWSSMTEPGTDRYAFDDQGQPLRSLQSGLEMMESRRITDLDRFSQRWTSLAEGSFPDGPPCLQTLESQGRLPEGTRNNGLFAIGVYLRKRFDGDEWKTRLHLINQSMVGLSHGEVETVIKSLSRKDYGYRCREAPIATVCDRETCVLQRYGIRDGGEGGEEIDESVFGGATKYVPGHPFENPQWAIEVEGRRVWLAHEEFLSKELVNNRCMAVLNRAPVKCSQAKWIKHAEKLAQSAEEIVLPEPTTKMGRLWEGVRSFCVDQTPATTLEEAITTGRPFGENGKVTVHLSALRNRLLELNHGTMIPEAFWQYCRWRGVTVTDITHEGSSVTVLILAEFPRAIEGLRVSSEAGGAF